MAQYFEVLSTNENSTDSQRQFFSGQENAVRYILADEGHQQFAAGQQVMVLNHSGGSQQLQGVVIDQRPLSNRIYHQTNSNQTQFVSEVGNMNNQQIFYMETNSQPEQSSQAVIEHTSIQVPRSNSQPQPIVLNHQLGSSNATPAPNRQVIPGAPQQRPVLHIRPPLRAEHGISLQRGPGGIIRQSVRPPDQSTPIKKTMGAIGAGSIQMRLKTSSVLQRQQIQQQQVSSSPPPLSQMPNKISQTLSKYQQQKQLMHQKQQQQQQQELQQRLHQGPIRRVMIGQQGIGTSSSTQQGLARVLGSEFNQQKVQEDELDDHDPSMNQTPGQMVSFKKMLEQRQQIGKNPILARLPSQIKITTSATTATNNQPNDPPQSCLITQTIEQVVQHGGNQDNQQVIIANQQQQTSVGGPSVNQPNAPVINMAAAQLQAQKKPRSSPKPKSLLNMPRPGGGGGGGRKGGKVAAQALSNFGPRSAVPQQPGPGPRFAMNQRNFTNNSQPMPGIPPQQPSMSQQPPHHNPSTSLPQQQQQPPVQPQSTQNGSQLPQNLPMQMKPSQMNYVIKPPTPDRPRQQNPLPSYIPSSQIQQIIGMFQENVPIPEEYSDSIRMLVLLENGEQRLITFTLPKEACTIQEILEQVSVPFTPETNIQVTEANTNGINYIVTVGNVQNFFSGNASSNEQQQQKSQQSQKAEAPEVQGDKSALSVQPNKPNPPFNQLNQSPIAPTPLVEPKPPTPEPPRYIPGKLAVCSYCGYSSEDFNKCSRCIRKLPDNVKTLDAPFKSRERGGSLDVNHKPAMSTMKTNNLPNVAASGITNLLKGDPVPKTASPLKKKVTKPKLVEPESFVISSDEEGDEKAPVRSVSEQLLTKLGSSISISPVTKEPSLNDIKKHVRKISMEPLKNYKVSIKCRTVRIGSYRFTPIGDVVLDSKCLILKAPVLNNKSEIKTIRIDRGDMVKVLVSYTEEMPVIFYYLNVGAAPLIRDMLNLKKQDNIYFDPVDEKEECYKRITLLPDDDLREYRVLINHLYGIGPNNIMEELNEKEANEILLKACPNPNPISLGSTSEVKEILMYPKEGQGRLSISTEDYACLAVDQFLNDIIIDFYLKYLWENMDPEQAKKVHIFSTFFYKRLTTKPGKAHKLKSHPYELDANLTAAEKRHLRVKNWTKKVNLFEKDYVIIPINENSHWFLAIVCFPGLSGPQTFDGKPYNPDPVMKKSKNSKKGVKKEKPIPCDDPMLSDKDEADSEDSDMESDESEESSAAALAAAVAAPAVVTPLTPPVSVSSPAKSGKGTPRQPIKQPCILIFDSLAGPSRARVVATLRDYLTCEFKTKMESERVFNRDVIKGSHCKVPQQNNFTDCGLYVLQYVEQFFKDPIKDYNIPIKGIDKWFEEIEVTKKREDLANLIKDLMEESGADVKVLPDIMLPTYKGKLIDRPSVAEQHNEEDDHAADDDMFTDIEDSELTDTSLAQENGTTKLSESSKMDEESESGDENSPDDSYVTSPVKPSDSSVGESGDIATTPSGSLKPTLSEFPRQTTDKDTLNYLKSKRIVKNKMCGAEGLPAFKRSKSD
ncbi:uncharacterized protein LOC126740074 isoform X2 [Anthonomus grandis grandis]|uniref:uncharacterized protein LOC126740074 isoform X2 n=1 Tax=Anthonomus grandis grandis TaxID=2921223 RepID=UPI0021661E0A|nr:uncharacterized protein LOC126740074 isoform X2 [Anthonomus grandis grandis]